MQTEIIISGFGGQGVLFAGQCSYAAWIRIEVTGSPHGPEMRCTNCTVIISDEEIGSPLVRNPKAVVAMNRPSLDKYDPLVKPGGLLIINSSIIDKDSERKDIQVVRVPGNEIAEKIGDRRMTNMVILGALLANLPILPLEALEKALAEHLPERHHKLLPLNYQALREGAKFVGEKV